MLFGRLKWLSASRFASSVSGLWTKARRGGRAIGNLVSRVFATGNVNMMAWLTETQLSEGLMFASIDVLIKRVMMAGCLMCGWMCCFREFVQQMRCFSPSLIYVS
jgi:hypothetical protein